MEVMVILVPLALALGLVGLGGFLWSLKSGQYDDLEGAAWRAIADDEPVHPDLAHETRRMASREGDIAMAREPLQPELRREPKTGSGR
jgi:cbb3-type cytochrome oxidase maturation protein